MYGKCTFRETSKLPAEVAQVDADEENHARGENGDRAEEKNRADFPRLCADAETSEMVEDNKIKYPIEKKKYEDDEYED